MNHTVKPRAASRLQGINGRQKTPVRCREEDPGLESVLVGFWEYLKRTTELISFEGPIPTEALERDGQGGRALEGPCPKNGELRTAVDDNGID